MYHYKGLPKLTGVCQYKRTGAGMHCGLMGERWDVGGTEGESGVNGGPRANVQVWGWAWVAAAQPAQLSSAPPPLPTLPAMPAVLA